MAGLSTNARDVLSMIVGFRMPASYATLEALLVGPDKSCRLPQELDRALTELEDRGLIGWDREANRYDAHPIVRGVVWQLTDAKNQHSVYTALEAHFEPMATPEWREVETLADLAPAIERYHTLISLRRYDDAFNLFSDRLTEAMHLRLAAHQELIACLERLFLGGVAELPALTNSRDQSRALDTLAVSYKVSGQPGRAVQLLQQANKIDERNNDNAYWAVGLQNLSRTLSEIGAFREAEGASRRAVLLDRKSAHEFREGISLGGLGHLLDLKGDHALAHVALYRSRNIFIEQDRPQLEGEISAYLADQSLWLDNAIEAGAWAELAWKHAAYERREQNFLEAALRQGRVALQVGDSARADERLHYVLSRARAINMVEFEIPALVAIAELEFKRGHTAQAGARLNDVWEAAERGPYPLHQADAYNVLANIAMAAGDTPAAIDAATKTYKAAWCDGPPYAYHWGLQKAKAHLAALGAPEPDMPPFDESKFEPLPEVEINPKDEYWVDPDKLD